MAHSSTYSNSNKTTGGLFHWGTFWLLVSTLGAVGFFWDGIAELLQAWQLPEYSHGPLIPVLSGLLFLRQLKDVPVDQREAPDYWPGVFLLIVSVMLGAAGRLLEINDIVAYALILWTGAILLISFGWNTGKHFWPPVVHLVYMLPLPGALYYGLSTYLQGISSELGVYFLQLIRVPVFMEGNIIDLGVYKLQVAEACSGLRYLFPILSFSYIFAVLYQGPMWHKAVLLISAAPITVFMNSVRIAVAGWIVNNFGLGHVEGFSHFFEGWVIFVLCILLLFLLAWVLVKLRRDKVGLIEALDLETDGLWTQFKRIQLIHPSKALIGGALLMSGLALAWQAVPERDVTIVEREPFLLFPARMGEWRAGPHQPLDPQIEGVLKADDYLSVYVNNPGHQQSVELFIAWYNDQSGGGVHSPEVCLPGAGWEIASLEQVEVNPAGSAFTLNEVVIQKGVQRMLAYYWYDQNSTRTASMYQAKLQLMLGKFASGRNDSAIVRLITPIREGEGVDSARLRLNDMLEEVVKPLQRFVP
ncbi:Transmembrane exosortase (Exosortase_EpsH) [Roseovarius albus]|uniref:Transmembrane exosortase (Exosortase_EpsH) n=1 Tax=Roseovarius albus TaxID=1247867 RepID=A0A1X6ZKY2_9RHOB|nr:VPLPA-CTERM-specific exosortase XrtD [Roseovarius albus]SLN54376.1 Transmembrane exosortase (Exosortase_EpsH) [Roseovarius albus]